MGARTWSAVVALAWLVPACAAAQDSPGLSLAVELSAEGDHAGAALEYRRLAGDAPSGEARGGWYWASAFEYWRAGEYELADRMLNRAEDAQPALGAPALLLRGENAQSARKWAESDFYFESVLRGGTADDEKAFASRRLAAGRLRQKDVTGAGAALDLAPVPQEAARAALAEYNRGRDKSPLTGGLLGIVPGFGYFYAGEWASGVRSILLNSLFLFGMVDTADHDQWGAFAVITFFEFTWYSGSIYGGIDGAHRFNRDRLETAADGIRGASAFEPDPAAWPAVRLNFRF
ncbi:MAG TPA: hypothetical protein P5567_03180 [Kiritimatiellia bacterium]|nr:hypothetical protein [Kiritimatiellia bacterium]HRZ11437.1 hypothetical protein [Kiritimatiellia bacterium]HSA17012.1 hypothetical protein [Kiritimatiellia bacterium]